MSGAEWIESARPHPACLDDDELLKVCTIGKGRGSGPGGQNRNKVETLVILTHEPTGVEAHAGERRSAIENKRVAIKRLRLALAVQVRCVVGIGEIRSALWKSRCRDGMVICSDEHRDLASLIAEAMDVIVAAGGDVRKAALRLCCSSSQLVKLLAQHPPALVAINALRSERGMRALK